MAKESNRVKRLQKIWVGLPKRIKVGAAWWSIVFEEGLESDDRRGLYGQAREQQSEIALNPDQSYSQARDTVLHEVLHCIRTNTLVGKTAAVESWVDLDEAIALQYTPFLLMVIQDNPGLIEWLQKEEEKA